MEPNSYHEYIPKLFNQGKSHPDILVESLSLSVCDLPTITYNLKLPKKLIKSGLLSSPQLETVVYASQAHLEYLPNQILRK